MSDVNVLIAALTTNYLYSSLLLIGPVFIFLYYKYIIAYLARAVSTFYNNTIAYVCV